MAMRVNEHGLHSVGRSVGFECAGKIGFDLAARGVVLVTELHANTGSKNT